MVGKISFALSKNYLNKSMRQCVFSAFFKPSWCPWEKKKEEEKKGLKSQREDFYHLDVPPTLVLEPVLFNFNSRLFMYRNQMLYK